jgi:CheY-like chemotaxis protein
MSMTERLRILHLEDNIDDAGLIQQALKNEGLVCEVDVITSSYKYLKALETGEYDLVLSDSGVPGIDALGALQLALQRDDGVPFVFVSGHFASQSDIDMLKAAGAAECLHKSDLMSVGKTIRRVLSRG